MLTTPVAAADRDDLLLERIRGRAAGPTIVYVTLQRTAEQVAARLAASGLRRPAYHAGMEDDDAIRSAGLVLRRGEPRIVVATIAFGMGIDKANIRYIYHYNLPKSLENYAQEIGRAGRDGQPSICEMFVCLDDLQRAGELRLRRHAHSASGRQSRAGTLQPAFVVRCQLL